MKMMVALAGVAIVLGVLLISTSPLITKTVYQACFFVDIGAFGMKLLSPRGEWFISLGRSAFAPFGVALFVLLGMAPLILLTEAGIAGYRGFSSGLRYASLALAVLGAAALAAGLVLPRLLRGR